MSKARDKYDAQLKKERAAAKKRRAEVAIDWAINRRTFRDLAERTRRPSGGGHISAQQASRLVRCGAREILGSHFDGHWEAFRKAVVVHEAARRADARWRGKNAEALRELERIVSRSVEAVDR
jgi:hypothetical protein